MSSDSDSELFASVAVKWWINNNTHISREFGVHPINQERQEEGEYNKLFKELKQYPQRFWEYMRMSLSSFNYIFELMEPNLQKVYCNLHKQPIEIEERLVITIRYLATGNSFKSLSFSFRVGASTVSKIIKDTTKCLWSVLQPLHMPQPTVEVFKETAKEFYEKWDFPNCVGSLDGKHIRVKCPANSGSMFYNYKQYFSIVLQALTDANYKFLIIDVGGYGKQSDAGTFRSSAMYRLLQNKSLNIPTDDFLPNSTTKMPFVFIADEAYPLLTNLLKPYSRRTLDEEKEAFNKRLSRARKTVECSFGIIFAKWRILGKCIETIPETADDIVKAICILHNTLIDLEGNLQPVTTNNEDKNCNPLPRGHNPASKAATSVRDAFKTYFTLNKIQYE